MFENVVVGVDGSWGGSDAAALAMRLAGPGGKLTLVHVHSGALQPLHVVTAGLMEKEQQRSLSLLEQARADFEVSAETASVVASSPGRGLHQFAERNGADLIVVGSCRRGVLGRVMLGDDTRAALNGAPCAIAIASRTYSEHPKPFAGIGVAYDGSPEAHTALATAKDLAQPTRAEVRALEVVSIPSYAFTGLMPPAIGETIEVMLRQAKERVDALEGVQGAVVYGIIGEELAGFSEHLDLLVVGSRNYGPLRRVVAGSTSDYLQRHARCSLLVMPRLQGGGETPAGERAAAA